MAERAPVPRPLGVLIHCRPSVLIGLLLWLIVPQAISQVQQGLGNVPTSHQDLKQAAAHSSGIKHDILVGLDRRLRHLPTGTALIHPALSITTTALEVLVGICCVPPLVAYFTLRASAHADLPDISP